VGKILKSAPAPRGRFFILSVIVVAIAFLLVTPALPQSEVKIVGRVIDQISGEPVPGATITISRLGKNSVTDALGIFRFNDLPAGRYEIMARRIGYFISAPVTVNVDDFLAAQVTIPMITRPVVVMDQDVIGARSQELSISSGGSLTVIEIPPNSVKSIENLLYRIPELQLIDSGPRKVLRLRGSQVNGVIVMLDGRIANSALISEGDISTIPLASVTRVEIVKGGSYKTEGFAGSINFITDSRAREGTISSEVERGSYGLEAYRARLQARNGYGIEGLLDVSDSYYRGDFEFTDPRDSVETRDNNSSHDLSLFGKLSFPMQSTRVAVAARYFTRQAGIPGPVFQLTPDANSRAEEKEVYTSMTMDLGKGLGLGVSGGITWRTAGLDSPRTPANFIAYKTRFKEDSRDLRIEVQSKGRFDLDTYFSLRYESLDGVDLIRPQSSFGRHARSVNTAGAGATYHFPRLRNITRSSSLTVGMKKEGGSGGDFLGVSTTFRLDFKLPLSPGADASFYRSRRLPDLADLYWKEDVFATPNPDLRSEKSTGYDIGLDIHLDRQGPCSARLSRFAAYYDDIIIWRKWAGDKFKPVNLSRANIHGWEFSVSMRPFAGPLLLFWNASLIEPLNEEREPAHYHKYLTFRPIGSQNVGLELALRPIRLTLTERHIGRRYVTEENTKSLPPADIMDLESAFEFKLSFLNVRLCCSILNAGNVQYEILERQPEKPRELRVKLDLARKGSLI
jgi:outer membrane cobalamin receptor